MATMGKYLKAYLVRSLREFPGWKEKLDDLRQKDTEEQTAPRRTQLKDNHILYFQFFIWNPAWFNTKNPSFLVCSAHIAKCK